MSAAASPPALFTALARAVEVPTRRIHGLRWGAGALSYDEWPEVFVDGAWQPVDPARGRTGAAAGTIRLGRLTDPETIRRDLRLAGARVEILPFSDASGEILLLRNGRAVMGKQVRLRNNRITFRLRDGEFSWPFADVAQILPATEENLLTASRSLNPGLYRNNLLALSLAVPTKGWSIDLGEGRFPDRGILLMARQDDGLATIRLIRDQDEIPLEVLAERLASKLQPTGATPTEPAVRLKLAGFEVVRLRCRRSRDNGSSIEAIFFERGSRRFLLAGEGKEDTLGPAMERWLEGLTFEE